MLTSIHAVQEQDSSGNLILVGVDGVQLSLCSSSDRMLTSMHAVQEQDSSCSLILVGVDGVQLSLCSSSDRMLTSVHATVYRSRTAAAASSWWGWTVYSCRYVEALTRY